MATGVSTWFRRIGQSVRVPVDVCGRRTGPQPLLGISTYSIPNEFGTFSIPSLQLVSMTHFSGVWGANSGFLQTWDDRILFALV